ncbi:MAG: DUF2924 domain-containing protein [Phycisphaerales bacterium]|nr:DUF2924 domain-containing protein [Phycisphaerales bacterium]
MIPTPDDIPATVKALGRLTVPELKQRYAEVFGEPTRSNHKQHLVKRIVWRMQALREGGLSERARQRDSGVRQHLLGVPVLRDVPEDRPRREVRHRDVVQAVGQRHQGAGLRRGQEREAAAVRHLPQDARPALQRAGGCGRGEG